MHIFRIQKEKDNINRYNHERNLEREKRKLEWKKINVIAREKEREERVKQLKSEEEILKKQTLELIIQQHLEKERVQRTIRKVKINELLDNKTKNFLKDQIPDIDIDDIYVKKKEEKKEGEEEM